MIWKIIARLRGFQEGFDVETGRLVVFRDRDCRWFYDWREAARCS